MRTSINSYYVDNTISVFSINQINNGNYLIVIGNGLNLEGNNSKLSVFIYGKS